MYEIDIRSDRDINQNICMILITDLETKKRLPNISIDDSLTLLDLKNYIFSWYDFDQSLEHTFIHSNDIRNNNKLFELVNAGQCITIYLEF